MYTRCNTLVAPRYVVVRVAALLLHSCTYVRRRALATLRQIAEISGGGGGGPGAGAGASVPASGGG